MNYRHAFHAGNHADVLKHVVLLALCEALTAKPAPLFALDTHAGRGRYRLRADAALRTGEAEEGIERLLAEDPRVPAITRYLAAVRACRKAHGNDAYPGSPWLLAHALREQDRIACCEIQPAVRACWRKASNTTAAYACCPPTATRRCARCCRRATAMRASAAGWC